MGAAQAMDRKVRSEGTYEANQLTSRVRAVETAIKQYEDRMAKSKEELQTFEEKADEELNTLREELEKAETARNSAESLCNATMKLGQLCDINEVHSAGS